MKSRYVLAGVAGMIVTALFLAGCGDDGDGGDAATYTLTVNCGSGDGSYAAGALVSISADAPGAGMAFDKWTGPVGAIANTSSTNTTVTMPATNTAVTATYAPIASVMSLVGTWTWTNLTLTGITVDIDSPELSAAGGSTVITPQTPGLNASASAIFGPDDSVLLSGAARSSETQSVAGTWTTQDDELSLSLTVFSLPVVVKTKYTVNADKLILTATWAQLQKAITDATAVPAERIPGLLKTFAATKGIILPENIGDIIDNLIVVIEFTR